MCASRFGQGCVNNFAYETAEINIEVKLFYILTEMFKMNFAYRLEERDV